MTLEQRFNAAFDSLIERFGLPAVSEGWELYRTQRMDQIDDDALVEALDRFAEIYEAIYDEAAAGRLASGNADFDRRLREVISGALAAEIREIQAAVVAVAIEPPLLFISVDEGVVASWDMSDCIGGNRR